MDSGPDFDLARFVERRQLHAYEQDMARVGYAYGVDLRRARWFATSALCQAAIRPVELRWYALTGELLADELREACLSSDIPLLAEIAGICRLLHMRAPGVRCVGTHARASGAWGLCTPMGSVRGSEDWLIVDPEGLGALSADERAFLLGAGLGHLQCGHGPIFVAELVAHRSGGGHLLRRLLAGWARVCVFSADRAGLLAAGALEPALAGLAVAAADRPPWYPEVAGVDARRLALEDFNRSRVVARTRTRRAVAILRQADIELAAAIKRESASAPDDAAGASDAGQNAGASTEDDAGPGEDPDGSPDPPRPEDTHKRTTLGVPRDAWPLAACDARLTRRLGLL